MCHFNRFYTIILVQIDSNKTFVKTMSEIGYPGYTRTKSLKLLLIFSESSFDDVESVTGRRKKIDIIMKYFKNGLLSLPGHIEASFSIPDNILENTYIPSVDEESHLISNNTNTKSIWQFRKDIR